VTVVVPARDAAATLPATLAGLAAQRGAPPFEVVVVDNGSSDDTQEIAERSEVVDRLLRRPRGEGPGAARNDGVAAARAELVAFVDSDCVPEPGWLAAGVAAIASGADLVQGRVDPDPSTPAGPFDRTLSVQSEYGLYETANMFVRKKLFHEIGPFVDFVGAGGRPFGEDAWWAWRARRAGARTAFAPDAIVHHAILPGDLRTWVADHGYRVWFPSLVSRVPELRSAFLWNRVFLNARTASFDAAVAGVVGAVAFRRPLAAVAAAPWALTVWRDVRRGRRRAAAAVAADVITFVSLVRGSVRARTIVI
jgi:glycosyltransferase involved in cell wall biosynthesis